MKWQFQWRDEISNGLYYDKLLPFGFVDPEDQEPTIEGLEFWLDAFGELGSARPVALDLSPIPFTAIVEYFRIYELEDFDEFAYLIRLMDNCFLRCSQEAREREKNASSNPGPKNHNQR